MLIKVLGSGAGGGLPQWNCNCVNCSRARAFTDGLKPRTQSSIAVSEDGEDWVLINASPDLLAQLRAHPELQPARSLRDSGIAAVMLCDAQIDHVTGLLMLRERTSRLPLYATQPVLDDLSSAFPLIPLLGHYCGVEQHPIAPGASFRIDPLARVRFTPIAIESAAPPYSPHRNAPVPGDNIALLIENVETGKRVFYAPGLVHASDTVMAAMQSAQLVLVDGTFWTDTEMIDLGLSTKHATDMGHLAQCPANDRPGMLALLDTLPSTTRKVLIHINNTNPILDPASDAHAIVCGHGIEIAEDGMELQVKP
ncbi:pyrroloquinoline quinone biosynthesis protein PqqB [Trinickia dinghuensis]|uniref:Coenzyme PQQ synthesis protein B n=1 Tax=Trinickia dinghuensis TaxID=2291023 RepID=A0A3D8JYG5_9BURK|nr:pyrroloquinoline quinone biosynthesis protein PqqB [Trinickia dinghuensis]RDU98203.1 pyrroloquinoline quinone biosynthesis protein PqqB [Trinickia dinghuensis]